MKYTHNNLYLWMCIAINIPSVICVFKLTNAVCESYNESWVVINTCRLKALRRDTTALYLNVTLVEPVENVVLNVALLKRANGYKPFLYNFTADVCQYLAKRNNPVFNLVFKFIKPYLIIDHWCPFEVCFLFIIENDFQKHLYF
ncbi:uncharacterized protein LOC119676198 [Teleopsis dalmanni]|uniref:uncharacterized protein LOC119676198 n=1 Tax=Teleopsis dalmanni TaxID=139649 RepID=UPI0018CD38AD|nr:uncharacterized protein LOC119676198 [Teleopsis dalmanni]